LNSLIKKDIVASISSLRPDFKTQSTCTYIYKISYNSGGLLSILYLGEPDPISHAITLDLKNKKILTLSDFVSVDEKFVDKARNSKYSIPGGSPFGSIGFFRSKAPDAEIASILQKGDSKIISFQYWFLTNDALSLFGPLVTGNIKYTDMSDEIRPQYKEFLTPFALRYPVRYHIQMAGIGRFYRRLSKIP